MSNNQKDELNLFQLPEQTRSLTSDVLTSLVVAAQEKTLTLRAVTERFGERTFGFLLLFFTVFNLVPIISIVAGILVFVLGVQMAIGVKSIVLPNWLLDKPLPSKQLSISLSKIIPVVRRLEQYVKPRWHFTEAGIVDRLNGVMIAFLGGIIAIPIPLTNLGPVFILILMGLGLLERDGVLQIISLVLGGLTLHLLYGFL